MVWFRKKFKTEEQTVYPGMTLKQAKKLSIAVRSFYVVVGPNSLKRLLRGKGTWPNEWNRATLGIGVYSFDNGKLAKEYREIKKERLEERGEKPDLHVVKITFSEKSIERFKKQGKEKDLRILTPQDYDLWMDQYSTYGEHNVERGKLKEPFLHNFLHVIVPRRMGIEHYFRPECLKEAIIEKVA